jgi:hypothetical protein
MAKLLERLARRACEWLAAHQTLPLREILRGIPPNEEPYLDRYYLFGRQPAYFPEKCKHCKQPIPVTSAHAGPADRSRICPKRGDLGRFTDKLKEQLGIEDELCEPMPFPVRLGFLPTVFLHHFRDSDQEVELHNHPWELALSLILAGGYAEERRVPDRFAIDSDAATDHWTTVLREVRPGTWNAIRKDDFHRVTLYEHDAWSLFITGKKAQSWSFWSKETRETVPWRQYRAWKAAQTGQTHAGPDPLLSQKERPGLRRDARVLDISCQKCGGEIPQGSMADLCPTCEPLYKWNEMMGRWLLKSHECSPPELPLKDKDNFRIGCAWTCYECVSPKTFTLKLDTAGQRTWAMKKDREVIHGS